jgi:hypothetical protein
VDYLDVIKYFIQNLYRITFAMEKLLEKYSLSIVIYDGRKITKNTLVLHWGKSDIAM